MPTEKTEAPAEGRRMNAKGRVALIRFLLKLSAEAAALPPERRPSLTEAAARATREVGCRVTSGAVHYYCTALGVAEPWWPRKRSAAAARTRDRVADLEARVEALEAAYLRLVNPNPNPNPK